MEQPHRLERGVDQAHAILTMLLNFAASNPGMTRVLIGDALVGEDVTRAAYLMEEALPALRRAREDQLMLAWIRALPPTVVRHSPVLSIWAGWARMLTGDLAGLEAHLVTPNLPA